MSQGYGIRIMRASFSALAIMHVADRSAENPSEQPAGVPAEGDPKEGFSLRLDRHVGDLQVVQGVDEVHFFFLSDSNSISLGSPVSASPAAAWNLRIAARVAGPTVP